MKSARTVLKVLYPGFLTGDNAFAFVKNQFVGCNGKCYGDIFGPVITGILLGLLAWQSVISISPLIASYLYQNWGMTATLFFTASLFAISAVIFASADLKQTRDADVKARGN